jgi:hypothetical protein
MGTGIPGSRPAGGVPVSNASLPGINLPYSSGPGVGENQPQATATVPLDGINDDIVDHQTVQFIDDDQGESLSFKDAGTEGIYIPIEPGIDLARFLSRPVQIATYAWSSSWTDQTFFPWSLFADT